MVVSKKTVRTGWREFWGILLIAFSILILLSLLSYTPEDVSVFREPPNDPARNFIGPFGAWLSFGLFVVLGLAAYAVPPILMIAGLLLIFKREGRVWTKLAWMGGILLLLSVLLQIHGPGWNVLQGRLSLTGGGGELGYLVGEGVFVRFLGTVGSLILAYALMLALVFVLIEIHPVVIARQFGVLAEALYRKLDTMISEHRSRKAQLEREEREIAKRRKRLEEVMKEQEVAKARTPEPKPAIGPAVIISPPRVSLPLAPAPETRKPEPEKSAPVAPRREKPKETADAKAIAMTSPPSGYRAPSLDLLDPLPPESARAITGDFQASAAVLKETLSEFGVEVDVTNVERGPVVTRYELLPAPGVRVEKIVQLSNNIALAMKAESVRVQAPIPGKGVVGIEVPNSKTTMVFLREIMESEVWQSGKAALPLALGKDVGGREIVADLAEMPHMLIAGATGSGKTVCMNSILAGLLLARTPIEMRLMLIDPKIVEFTQYNKLPHLVVPVITDAKKVAIGLRWAITEMEKRYRIFAKAGVRNIKAYNSRPIVKQAELFEGEAGLEGEGEEERAPDRLPYIVIVVDELADLMLVAQAEIENSIARLAQLSRAVGIHMILATQRPSVNVITGTIKANFPARISFQVAQKVDSRTILDANGADKLLGKGDMLFLPPGSSKLIRAQGTMTSDAELRRIVDYIRLQGEPEYESEIHEKIERKGADIPDVEEDDDLLEAAIEVIRQTRRASTSSLQRRLRIGYTRAARLVDILEERGVVGPPRGSDPREILIDLDGEIPQNTTGDEEL
ncbi:MAG: DNA translocase SpoIIIE [Verrucomicrobia bacterium ADurb.Bin345]|nr:MAG: DNA translocase SpoIIIE [Verrucomicrobia bacterium ADurb.Bin345]